MSPSTPPSFLWYELMTHDTQKSVDYYRRVVGWSAAPAGFGPVPYTVLSAGTYGIGGVFELTAEMRAGGARPSWVGYIAVDDVDAYAARVRAAGGAIHVGPMDMAEVGRFAMAADPHGAAFVLFRPLRTEPMPTPPPGTPGTVGWRELHAGDGAAAFRFYADLFGWTKDRAVDMGAMGVYHVFAAGGPAIGGMMTKTPQTPAPFWLYYFDVEAIDAAAQRATAAGGTVVDGPVEVPGGQWVVQCLDPEGAMFALIAPRR